MKYRISEELAIPVEASQRYSNLSRRESEVGYRVIGGDQGDLHFCGYNILDGRSVLVDPELSTTLEELSDDEVFEIAQSVLQESYESIGAESIEHS